MCSLQEVRVAVVARFAQCFGKGLHSTEIEANLAHGGVGGVGGWQGKEVRL